MSKKISGIRGMNATLPELTPVWREVEGVLRNVVERYGYREFRVPLVERTELFKRSIGEVTDIVEKEMYSFTDRNGEGLTLRPEATAGMVRAAIELGLLHNQKHKFWCTGPMFRYEKPQKGRYRQFHQFDVEVFGYSGPDVDAELILMTARFWRELGIHAVELQLNSLGTPESRAGYREVLVDYFAAHRDDLDAENLQRLQRNPLRLLDSKLPEMQPLIAAAPRITEHLDAESAEHFAELQALLQAAGLEFTVNPRLVRGLDYYTRTVFEWVTDALGAQGTVCAGGRYDGLVEQLGGRDVPAIGFALGLERLLELYMLSDRQLPGGDPDVYIVAVGDAVLPAAVRLAEELRDALPTLAVELNADGGSFKAQFKRADKSGAAAALIVGEAELAADQVSIKWLRSADPQITLSRAAVAATLRAGIERLAQ
jgi:histidyl-tRNA synthetase